MSTLRECQLGFARAVADAHFARVFAARIQAQGLTGERRIQVYRNNRFACLGEALAAVYPVVRRLVGAAFFAQAAAQYVRAHPSLSGDIHRYGGEFGAFLRSAPGVGEHPYLPDVAALEWAYHSVFHRNRAPAMDIARLAAVPPGAYARLRFDVQPAAQLYASPYPVLQIWQANQDDTGGGQSIRLDAGATRLLVQREADGVVFQPLGAGEYVLLEQLAAGVTLTEAFERACDTEPHFDLGAALRQQVLQATLTGVRIAGDHPPSSLNHGG